MSKILDKVFDLLVRAVDWWEYNARRKKDDYY